MALILDALIEILKKPTIGDVLELILFATPLWVAVFVGLVVGWAWKPRWVAGLGREEKGKPTANSYNCGLQLVLPSWASLKDQISSFLTCFVPVQISEKKEKVFDLSSARCDKKELVVDYDDLRNLSALVETEDGGPAWIHMMDKSLPTMSYQAWRRDPATGPPQYRSRSVFEDATPEIVRDFFWDDEFRIKNKWDDMLLYQAPLEECSVTGTMIVHWIRKFPFFCSDREYTIARRIWEVNGAYYCVTKGVPFTSLPRRNKPRRVDLYYSSWCIRSVESPLQGDGRKTACEVLLFHYEDMGIPWELAKLGVRQGMWSCVKKIEPGLRAYQAATKSGEPLSHSAAIAQINTKVSAEYLRSLGSINDTSQEIVDAEKEKEKEEKPWVSNMPKFLIVGGAVALACTLDRGLLTKAVIFGVARRFAKIGRRL